MQIITSISELKKVLADNTDNKSVGLVPTTGYIHKGHEGLIEKSVADNDVTVVTIVPGNSPNSQTPVHTYEGNIDTDADIISKYGAQIVFCPTADELYPEGFCTSVDMTGVTEQLIGLARPEHYRNYCTCMVKLFNIVKPDRAYYGRKDPQQLAVVHKLVADLNIDVEIVGCDICREKDGLAISSNNSRLTPEERESALCLYRAIEAGKAKVAAGEKNAKTVLSVMKKIINDEPLAVIDYIKALDIHTMQAVSEINPGTVVTVAVYIGRVRLIDNFNV